MIRQISGVGLGVLLALIGTSTAVAAPTPPPKVTSVAPAAGPVSGGTKVTVEGTGFTHVTRVEFGSTPGASFRVLSARKLTVVEPAGDFGVADIEVVTRHGTSAVTSRDRYTFDPVMPTVLGTNAGDSAGDPGSLGCDTSRTASKLPVLGREDVTIWASVSSPITGPETLVVGLNHVGQATPFDVQKVGFTASPTPVRIDWTFPSSELANADQYGWTAYVTATSGASTWSSATTSHCYFTVDNLTPDAPKVTSSEYPPESTARSASSGNFQFCPGGTTEADKQITEYQYSFNGATPLTIAANPSTHCADPTITPVAGSNQLVVTALIPGGDESNQTTYTFWA